MEVNIDLNALICDTFTTAASEIIQCKIDRGIFKGGRSSTKSQMLSESILVGCMVYKQSAVCLVKYNNKVYERLVSTFSDSLKYLKLQRFWKLRRSPYEYVLLDEEGKETDVSIKFTGADNPETLKSYKGRSPFRYIWFEEVTNFTKKEVDSLIQTLGRGVGEHCVLMSYNPPMSTSSWVNKEYNVPTGKILGHNSNYCYTEFNFSIADKEETIRQLVHHSTYIDVIEAKHSDWLGSVFVGEAEKSKKNNERYYRWAYLGEVVGTDANVFSNIKDWNGDKGELNITEVFRGLDFGLGGPDPTAYVEWYYNRKDRTLYALNEFYRSKMSIDDISFNIKQFNKHNFPIYADSATPILISQLVQKGIHAIGVKKKPDSVRAGVKWLQSLNGIYINKYQTPNVYREFKNYEYLLNKEEEITAELADKDNHTIDATRYALNLEIKYD